MYISQFSWRFIYSIFFFYSTFHLTLCHDQYFFFNLKILPLPLANSLHRILFTYNLKHKFFHMINVPNFQKKQNGTVSVRILSIILWVDLLGFWKPNRKDPLHCFYVVISLRYAIDPTSVPKKLKEIPLYPCLYVRMYVFHYKPLSL